MVLSVGISDAVWQEHQRRVDAVAAAMKSRQQGERVTTRKSTGHHQVHCTAYKDACKPIDVSPLANILGFVGVTDRLGREGYAVVAEGQITMEQLAAYTLPHGYLPQVVPEYNNFTVGGLTNGEGIQSSCFRYGLWSHTLAEIEMVVGSGEVVRCKPESLVGGKKGAAESPLPPDLFAAVPESMGTLGIVTLAYVCLRPAQTWVRSRYEFFGDLKAFHGRFRELCALGRCDGMSPAEASRAATSAGVGSSPPDFLEGLVIGPSAFLAIISHFVDDSAAAAIPQKFYPLPRSVNGEEYYYRYLRLTVVKGVSIKDQRPGSGGRLAIREDCIPSDQFLFRPVRGAWWMVDMVAGSDTILSLQSVRRKADRETAKVLGPQGFGIQSKHMTSEDNARCYVLQDLGVVLPRLEEVVTVVNAELGVYPLWLCPVSLERSLKPYDHRDGFKVDVGIYGEPTVQPFRHRRAVPKVVAFVDEPSTWGMEYAAPEAGTRHEGYAKKRARLEELRKIVGSDAAFPSIQEKIAIKHTNKKAGGAPDLDEGPIPYWRIVKDYGYDWQYKLARAVAALAVTTAVIGYAVQQVLLGRK